MYVCPRAVPNSILASKYVASDARGSEGVPATWATLACRDAESNSTCTDGANTSRWPGAGPLVELGSARFSASKFDWTSTGPAASTRRTSMVSFALGAARTGAAKQTTSNIQVVRIRFTPGAAASSGGILPRLPPSSLRRYNAGSIRRRTGRLPSCWGGSRARQR
jgi:hypothetical protein